MADDMRSAQNLALLDTSFLYGGNATFIEQQQAKWAENPASVDASWAAFFAGMGDSAGQAQQAASGPSWKRADWPKSETSEMLASIDGNWALIEPKIEKKIARHT
jgi:2-oxoglutarate dehydrogenase E1 component